MCLRKQKNLLHFYLQKRGKLKQHVYIAISDEHLSRIGKVQERTDSHRTLVIQIHGTISTFSHIHLKHGPKPKADTCDTNKHVLTDLLRTEKALSPLIFTNRLLPQDLGAVRLIMGE